MKIALVLGFSLLLGVSAGAMAQPAAGHEHTRVRLKYHTEVRLQIDVHGQVAEVGMPSNNLPVVLVAPVRKAVATWRFKAPVRKGHPVTSTTWAYVAVKLAKRGHKHYDVQVTYAGNGPQLVKACLPRYPQTERLQDRQALLLIGFEVAPDGSVRGLRLLKSRGQGISKFFTAVRKAVRCWHATPMRINGKAVASLVRMPFIFTLRSSYGPPKSFKFESVRSPPAWARQPGGVPAVVDNALQRIPAAHPSKATGKG